VNFVSLESWRFPRLRLGKHWYPRETKFTVRLRLGKHWESRETKFTVPQGTSHLVICYIAKQNKSKFWKTHGDSSDSIRPSSTLHALISSNSSQHFAGNSELFPICLHSFRNVARSRQFAVTEQFHCEMSCDHELANELARCSGKNASSITIRFLFSSKLSSKKTADGQFRLSIFL